MANVTGSDGGIAFLVMVPRGANRYTLIDKCRLLGPFSRFGGWAFFILRVTTVNLNAVLGPQDAPGSITYAKPCPGCA